MKIPVLVTPEFKVYLEEDHGFTFIHCDVLVKWSRQLKATMLDALQKIVTLYGKPLYASHNKEDKKHEKFLKMYGFTYHTTVKGLDNNDYDIYVWR